MAVLVAIFLVYPACTIFFLARRGTALILFVFVAVVLYFVRGISMPRWLIASACFAGGLIVVLAPTYRSSMAFTGDLRGSLNQLEAQETVASTFRGESYSEFDALIIHSAFSQREKRFDFGGGFYNGLISTMVPRQWVGEQFKTSLMLDLHTGDFKNPGSSYGWEMPYGSNPTGVLQAFNEFWFFGALLYFGLSWWLARVWWRASRGDCLHQAAYALLAPWALVAIAGAWSTLPQAFLLTAVFLWPVKRLMSARLLVLSRRDALRRSPTEQKAIRGTSRLEQQTLSAAATANQGKDRT